jgi:hypothetical protein
MLLLSCLLVLPLQLYTPHSIFNLFHTSNQAFLMQYQFLNWWQSWCTCFSTFLLGQELRTVTGPACPKSGKFQSSVVLKLFSESSMCSSYQLRKKPPLVEIFNHVGDLRGHNKHRQHACFLVSGAMYLCSDLCTLVPSLKACSDLCTLHSKVVENRAPPLTGRIRDSRPCPKLDSAA